MRCQNSLRRFLERFQRPAILRPDYPIFWPISINLYNPSFPDNKTVMGEPKVGQHLRTANPLIFLTEAIASAHLTYYRKLSFVADGLRVTHLIQCTGPPD